MRCRWFCPLVALLVLFLLALSSCDDGVSLKPRSSGEPYDVVVVANDSRVRTILSKMVETPLPGLPQQENAFDVSHAADATALRSSRYARAIVVVDIDASRHSATRLR